MSLHAAHERYEAHEKSTPHPVQLAVWLMRLPAVLRATGMQRTSIYDRVRAGTFPRPVAITSTARAWRSDEIEAWIERRTAERDA